MRNLFLFRFSPFQQPCNTPRIASWKSLFDNHPVKNKGMAGTKKAIYEKRTQFSVGQVKMYSWKAYCKSTTVKKIRAVCVKRLERCPSFPYVDEKRVAIWKNDVIIITWFVESHLTSPYKLRGFVLVITCFWGWFGKNQPEVLKEYLKSTRARVYTLVYSYNVV